MNGYAAVIAQGQIAIEEDYREGAGAMGGIILTLVNRHHRKLIKTQQKL